MYKRILNVEKNNILLESNQSKQGNSKTVNSTEKLVWKHEKFNSNPERQAGESKSVIPSESHLPENQRCLKWK